MTHRLGHSYTDFFCGGASLRVGYLHDIDKEWPVYPGMIDDIGMVYEGNQLKDAWENLNDQELANVSTNDFRDVYEENRTVKYLYDANGNQFADFNKGIAWIKYNLLNLPQTIQFANGNKTEYMYDAAGIKQSARWSYSTTEANIQLGDVANENNSIGTTSTTDYCGAYVYEQGKLRRILTPEGYVSANGVITPNAIAYWQHVYLLKDHLGNTRKIMLSNYLSSTSVALTERPQAIDYYPFGMEITKVDNADSETYSPGYMGGFVTPYLYNGKEMDRMHGLNSYDHGARWRDGVIPAWPAVDPLAEKYYSFSPYVYCGNNPVTRIDPDGMDWYSYEERYKDKAGKEQTRTAYKYVKGEMSEKEMKEGGFTHLGKTYDNGKGTYYSLGGAEVKYDNKNAINVMGVNKIKDADNSIIATIEGVSAVGNFWDKYGEVINNANSAAEIIGEFMDLSKGFRGAVGKFGKLTTYAQVGFDAYSLINGDLKGVKLMDAVVNVVSLAGTPGAAISLTYSGTKKAANTMVKLEYSLRTYIPQLIKNANNGYWPF